MATLYVENVPDDLYDALRRRARQRRSSIAAEVIKALKVTVPTAAELRRRNAFYKKVLEYRSQAPLSSGPFPSAEELIREDRER